MLVLEEILALSTLIPFVLGIALTLLLGKFYLRRLQRLESERLRQHIDIGRRESEVQLQDYKARAELELGKRRLELEQELLAQRLDLKKKEDEILSALLNAEKERDSLEKRRQAFEDRLANLEKREVELSELASSYRTRLQDAAGWSAEAARSALEEEVRRECEGELRELKKQLLNRAEREVKEEARRTLVACMQRLASQPHHDITATMVSLPSEDMKGRIIGREGRNIKCFESKTGTTLLIDETPDSVLISSFDPVRREVARLALESLVKDGRIHPTSIEESIVRAEDQVKQSVIEFGEDALRRLRLSKMHPEIVTLLGRMRYRLSNNQNCLDHSIEVANLCALVASELGLDTELAKRCGLLHDIGKALDEEYEGSHAIAGSNYLKRYGNEDARVINAVAAHHEEVPAESAYVPLLMMADSLSAMRPGARAESMDSYIQRVRNLETIAKSFEGVQEAYAIQAGREIRVIVAPERINDDDARTVARKIRRRIEEELQYPGTIRVTVIREQRVTETAK